MIWLHDGHAASKCSHDCTKHVRMQTLYCSCLFNSRLKAAVTYVALHRFITSSQWLPFAFTSYDRNSSFWNIRVCSYPFRFPLSAFTNNSFLFRQYLWVTKFPSNRAVVTAECAWNIGAVCKNNSSSNIFLRSQPQLFATLLRLIVSLQTAIGRLILADTKISPALFAVLAE